MPIGVLEHLGLKRLSNSSSVDELAAAATELSEEQRHQLLRRCESLVDDRTVVADEEQRVTLAKTLVAILPESLSMIEHILSLRSDPLAYEIRFSIFCFLDDAERIFPRTAHNVLALVARYLRTVSSDEANAAWMAGHLLGDHWEGAEATEILTELAMKAEHPVGRIAAIDGLAERMERSPSARHRLAEILHALEREEGNPKVRAAAQLARRKAQTRSRALREKSSKKR